MSKYIVKLTDLGLTDPIDFYIKGEVEYSGELYVTLSKEGALQLDHQVAKDFADKFTHGHTVAEVIPAPTIPLETPND